MMRQAQILMIEDDPADAELVREAFKDLESRPRLFVAADGEKAFEYLRDPANRRPDLILLDLNLPRMDGRDVLRALKSDPALKKVPIVVLTTSGAEADVQQAYSCGANCFLTKPLGLDDFFRMTKILERFWLRLARLPGRAAAAAPSG